MNRKNFILKINLDIVFILLACNLAVGQSDTFEAVAPEKIPDILKTIAVKTKENFERIHTWQGEIEFSRSDRTINFRCDLSKDQFYSSGCGETQFGYTDSADKNVGPKSSFMCYSHILTNEYYISSGPSAWKKGTEEVTHRSATKQKVEKKDPSCVTCNDYIVYDPRNLFDFLSPPWKSYSKLAKTIEEKGKFINEKGEYVNDGYVLKIEQGNLSGDIQYRISVPSRINLQGYSGIIWIIRTFSANAGYNMISYQAKRVDGPLVQQKNLEYQKINDVFIPTKYIYETFDYNNSSLQNREEEVFKNIKINEDIPAETFTYKNLGLKDGDKYIDKIEKKEYKYENKKLVFVKDINEPAKPKQ